MKITRLFYKSWFYMKYKGKYFSARRPYQFANFSESCLKYYSYINNLLTKRESTHNTTSFLKIEHWKVISPCPKKKKNLPQNITKTKF